MSYKYNILIKGLNSFSINIPLFNHMQINIFGLLGYLFINLFFI